MSVTNKPVSKVVFAVLLVFSAAAMAGSVIIGGTQYSCQNECVVTLGVHGWMLSDSGGGWIHNDGPARKVTPPSF